MHVRGVASQQHPVLAVGRRLPGHIGEPGDRGWAVDPEIGAVHGDERLAEIAQGRLFAGPDLLFGHQNPHRSIVRPAEGMNAEGVAADAPLRLLGYLDLGDEVAGCRVRTRRINAGGFTDKTSSTITPDQVFRIQRLAIGQLDFDAANVLGETRHLTPVIGRYTEFINPGGEYALDMLLPQGQPVVVPGRKVADVQRNTREPGNLCNLSL